jgi:hypothetical protein
MIHMKRTNLLAALLLVALLSAANSARVPHSRMLLDDLKTCEDKCKQQFDKDVATCRDNKVRPQRPPDGRDPYMYVGPIAVATFSPILAEA